MACAYKAIARYIKSTYNMKNLIAYAKSTYLFAKSEFYTDVACAGTLTDNP